MNKQMCSMPDEMIQVFHICMRLQTNGQEKKRTGIRINRPKMYKTWQMQKLIPSEFSPIYSTSSQFLFFSTSFISQTLSISPLKLYAWTLFYFFSLSEYARIFNKTNTDQNHLSFSLLGYLGQLNFTVESKILAQTFGKINPVCEDSLNDI